MNDQFSFISLLACKASLTIIASIVRSTLHYDPFNIGHHAIHNPWLYVFDTRSTKSIKAKFEFSCK
jgi:hypothetical protein